VHIEDALRPADGDAAGEGGEDEALLAVGAWLGAHVEQFVAAAWRHPLLEHRAQASKAPAEWLCARSGRCRRRGG
jgi:hypothetical protein